MTLVDLKSGVKKQLRLQVKQFQTASWHPDGKTIATASDQRIHFCTPQRSNPTTTPVTTSNLVELVVDDVHAYTTVEDYNRYPAPSDIVRHKLATGEMETLCTNPVTTTGMCAFKRKTELLTSDLAGNLKTWGMASGQVTSHLAVSKKAFGALTVSNNGRRVAALRYGYPTSELHLLSVDSAGLKLQQSTTTEGIEIGIAVAFSSNGNLIALGGFDDGLQIWGWDGKRKHVLAGHGRWTSVCDLIFSSDDRYLFSCGFDENVRVWDTKSGELIRTLQHFDDLFTLCLAANDRLITGGAGRKFHLWDWRRGRRLGSISVEAPTIRRIRITPDGTKLVTAHSDGSVRVQPLIDSGGKVREN